MRVLDVGERLACHMVGPARSVFGRPWKGDPPEVPVGRCGPACTCVRRPARGRGKPASTGEIQGRRVGGESYENPMALGRRKPPDGCDRARIVWDSRRCAISSKVKIQGQCGLLISGSTQQPRVDRSKISPSWLSAPENHWLGVCNI